MLTDNYYVNLIHMERIIMKINNILFLLFLCLGLHAEKNDKLSIGKTNMQAEILIKKIENNNINDRFISLLKKVSENAKLLKDDVIKSLGKSLKIVIEKAEQSNQELYDKLLSPYMDLEYNFEGRSFDNMSGF